MSKHPSIHTPLVGDFVVEVGEDLEGVCCWGFGFGFGFGFVGWEEGAEFLPAGPWKLL